MIRDPMQGPFDGGHVTVRIRGRTIVRTVAVLAVGLVAAHAAPVRIMPLGDSITQADSRHGSYRRPLWKMLVEAGYAVDFVGTQRDHFLGPPPFADFDTDHEGRWGWSADRVAARIAGWARGTRPDIVLVHLGTNDVARGRDASRIAGDLGRIVEALRRQNPRVAVLLARVIPAVGAEARLRSLNVEIERLARSLTTAESPVIAVDHADGFDARTDTYDGLHPNERGERKMAEAWFRALVAAGLLMREGKAAEQNAASPQAPPSLP